MSNPTEKARIEFEKKYDAQYLTRHADRTYKNWDVNIEWAAWSEGFELGYRLGEERMREEAAEMERKQR